MELIDFTILSNFFKDVYDFVVFLIHYITDDFFQFLTNTITFWLKKFTIWSIEWTIYSMALSFSVAQELLAGLNISAHLDNAYSNLDNGTIYFLSLLRFPEIVNNLLSGLATAFVFSFMPRA